MTISQQIKAFYGENISAIIDDAEERAIEITQNWDHESTEFDFVDGSVLIVTNDEVFTYGSR